MKRGFLAALVLAMIIATPAFARSHHSRHGIAEWGSAGSDSGDDGTFSAATLNGTYVFEASGFVNDGSPGSAVVLGTLTFDGAGGVTGNLTMTAADGGQFSCANTFATGGTYTLPAPASGPGLGTLVLPMTTGSLNFNLLVPSPEGKTAAAVESDTGVPLATFCSAPALNSIALKARLTRVGRDD
jgi:hypothetical protein